MHNQPISNIDQCKLLMKALSHFNNFTELKKQFLYAHPLVQNQTFSNLKTFVGTHFSMLEEVEEISSYGSAFSSRRSSSPRQSRPSGSSSVKVEAPTSTTTKSLYCTCHGWNATHKGQDCFTMKKKKNIINKKTGKPFTKAEINATGRN
jgi:hypothetical protein